jgi:RNA polymerase sigma-70 factor (ECF subfamily)
LAQQYDRIHAVCRRITGNESDADDATQEALLAVVRGLARFTGESRFSTWVYRVAVNASLDELRRRKRRPEPAEPDMDWTAGAGRGSSVEAAVIDRMDIDAALARLPVEFRTAVVLRDLAGLDYAGIAEVLDLPIGTVRSRISRGRAALVPLLTDFRNSPPELDRPSS